MSLRLLQRQPDPLLKRAELRGKPLQNVPLGDPELAGGRVERYEIHESHAGESSIAKASEGMPRCHQRACPDWPMRYGPVTWVSTKRLSGSLPEMVAVTVVMPACGVFGWALKVTMVPPWLSPEPCQAWRSCDQR